MSRKIVTAELPTVPNFENTLDQSKGDYLRIALPDFPGRSTCAAPRLLLSSDVSNSLHDRKIIVRFFRSVDMRNFSNVFRLEDATDETVKFFYRSVDMLLGFREISYEIFSIGRHVKFLEDFSIKKSDE